MASAVLRVSRRLQKLYSVCAPGFDRPPLTYRRNFHLQFLALGQIRLDMPSLSPTMTVGTIVKWYKKEGDPVTAGDLLFDVQTDKAVVSVDTEEEGILAKILVPENSKDIPIGTLVGLLVEEGDDWQNVEVPTEGEVSATKAEPPKETTSAAKVQTDTSGHFIWPSVRKLLEEYNIDISVVPSSGPHGIVTKGDVLKYVTSKNLTKIELKTEVPESPRVPVLESQPPPTQPLPPAPLPPLEGEAFTDIPNTNMRKTIAKRLTESKTTIPHSYATLDCDIGPVSAIRKLLKDDGIKVSVNDFIIKAVALALQRVPQVNCVWQGDTPQLGSAVDVSVAVATKEGLITPIVKNAPYLGVDEISRCVKDLASRAREGKLQLQEFQGGTFTISNLGMFGISEFSAVINPPQTAIMAVGSSRLVVDGEGKPQTRMSVTLSYDARVIDEVEASKFLEVFQDIMETPRLMLSGTNLSASINSRV